MSTSNGNKQRDATSHQRMLVVDDHGRVTPLDQHFASAWKVPRAGKTLPLNQRFSQLWEIPQAVLDQLSDENSLRNALDQEEFVVHYQPQYCARTGEIVGAEALVRWDHPAKGLVPPLEFIGLAEESGLIVPLGEWVMRRVCKRTKSWQDAGLRPGTVAVNVSPRQFRDSNLLAMVENALVDSGLGPESLEIEITEGTAMQDTDRSEVVLRAVAGMGSRISIDDFGSGYSSLGYLKRFPLHSLKIDQSFVRGVASDANDAAIAVAILAMSQALNLEVVAEGVETEEQLTFFSERGCQRIQGFYLGTPMPEEDFAALLGKAS